MIKGKFINQRYFIIALAVIGIVFVVSMILYPGSIDFSKLIEDNGTEAALIYYQEKYGNGADMDGIRAASIRLGCHQEIRIYRGNEILMRANYVNGRIYE